MSEADTTVGQLVEPAAEEVTAPVEDPSTGDGATQPAGEEEKEAGNPAAPDTDAAAATAAAVAARLIQQHEEQAGAVYGSNPYDVSQTAAGFEGFPGPDGADGNNKRPRDGEGVEHEEDGPDKKRASTNFLSSEGQAAPENPGGAEGEAYGNPGPGLGDFSTSTTASTVFDIPANMVGKLIGRSGETIRNLQLSTDTRIQVDHEGGGDTRRITITGMTQDQVDRCRREVEGLTGEEEVQETMECPAGIVGRIIGRGGETIRALQSASQAHITVDQNFPEGQPRKVIISGTAAAAPGYGAPAAAAGAGDPYAAAGAYGAYGGAQGYGAAAYGGAPGGAQAGGPAAGGLPGASAGGASQWQELHDDQGRAYYYNATTGVTQWERPADL
ncbi:CRB1 [Auxenochlorella protothecoides x Auxenochlorella symbiontica]